MNEKKKAATPYVSAATDTEQPPSTTTYSVSHTDTKSKHSFRTASSLTTRTLSDVLDEAFPARIPIIDNFIAPGLYVLAGAPKIGKSFLSAQFAYHVACGQNLWGRKVWQGDVLYLALEDDFSRLQTRYARMYGTDGTDHLFFATAASSISHGLCDQLTDFVSEHPSTKLIVIDTLQKVKDADRSDYSYAQDYEVLSAIKSFADNNGICILLIHHTRKMMSEDRFDMISGTTAITGCADGMMVFYKDSRTSNSATLDITGRDFPEQRMYLTKSPDTLIWNLDHEDLEPWKPPIDPLLQQVAHVVSELSPEWTGTASELSNALNMSIAPNSLSRYLNAHTSLLAKDYNVLYIAKRTSLSRTITLRLLSTE